MNNWIIYTIGFLAQFIFASRIIIQWFKSEKAKKLKTPVIFWKLSLLAAMLFFVYGYLQRDFSIMLGQSIIYSVFIRNLQLQNEWKPTSLLFKILVIGFPIFVAVYAWQWANIDYRNLFSSQGEEGISTLLLFVGIIGQIIYTFRFIYQWIYAEKENKSELSLSFWVISLIGSTIILVYAIFREDPVLLAAHVGGSIIYLRNIYIGYRTRDN